MKKMLRLLLILLLVIAAKLGYSQSVTVVQTKDFGWCDSLVIKYIQNSNNELIKLALRDSMSINWIFDRQEIRNGIMYYVINIGQENAEDYEDSDGLIFSSDGWIYIDSLKRKIYEYDLPADSLVEWKK